jgi:hypothetical protein
MYENIREQINKLWYIITKVKNGMSGFFYEGR